tara:strand:- start:143 stop:577 length:435 start_codon:yes stop_codon:yes gene_type:complete
MLTLELEDSDDGGQYNINTERGAVVYPELCQVEPVEIVTAEIETAEIETSEIVRAEIERVEIVTTEIVRAEIERAEIVEVDSINLVDIPQARVILFRDMPNTNPLSYTWDCLVGKCKEKNGETLFVIIMMSSVIIVILILDGVI